MNIPDTTLEIVTLGCFSISVDGQPVAETWPNETVKVFFCSLLSPLDLYFTWDRLCRCMLGVPETRTSRSQLEEVMIRPLSSFMIKEVGFNPLLVRQENIRMDQRHIHSDAHDFHTTAVEGLRLLSLGNRAAARENLSRANSLYAGCYLPEIHGKIIENTRDDLSALHQTSFKEGI